MRRTRIRPPAGADAPGRPAQRRIGVAGTVALFLAAVLGAGVSMHALTSQESSPLAPLAPLSTAVPALMHGQWPLVSAPARNEVVVAVHGLGRTEFSMLLLAWSLERQGYEVLNWGYSSICCSVEELGRELARELEQLRGREQGSPARIHFVGHSLGNIIIRWVVANDPTAAWGNVVMLAPPNRGSHAADEHAGWLAWLLRPLPELITAESSTARTLPWPEHVAAGVIAGRFDGKVTVEETHLPGEAGHVVVPAAHTFIMNRADVRRLTLTFLRDGRFNSQPAASR